MAKFLNLLLVLLLLSSCNDISSTSSEETDSFLTSEKTTNTLHIELVITSENFKNLEDIKAQFKLKNISGTQVIYEFSSGCQLGYTVTRNQNAIFDSQKNSGCIGILTELKLEPDQTKTFPISLDIFRIDKKLDQGMYQLKAFLLENHTPEISASFKVE